ncbi:DUF6542 domain-containing protein [Nocardioides jiangxiensis]|uniref:DUF6542 domain-containing protein n=1 Tax=Nocardioides jiangxiensis TaxID=3064524 RepID=A0ABT9B5L0_9ACTN|nr:DUF6542 domain-containing protein [Nocardioides sp. WY-20]MDO7868892.1 hypothetical protein [Nocardioides sp. WY-20]
MTAAPTIWDEGTESARRVVLLGVALTLTVTALDLVIGRGLGIIFDIGFVLIAPALALRVHPRDFFPISVTPPLLMLGLFLAIAADDASVIARADDGLVQATLSGLAHHSWALVLGYAACLAFLQIRRKRIAAGLARPRRAQASKRSASPAPRRTTSGVPSE